MLKFLLLALACGLAQAADELSGDWRTIAIAANNPEKIMKGGPLRLYVRHLACDNGCEELAVTFYIHVNGQCQKIITMTKHTGNGVYQVQYEGDNHFEVADHMGDLIAFTSENVDATGKATKLVFLVAKGRGLDGDQKEKLEKFVESQGISKDNIEYVLDTDVCPK